MLGTGNAVLAAPAGAALGAATTLGGCGGSSAFGASSDERDGGRPCPR